MYEFSIQTMTCGHCVSTVEKAIKAADPTAVAAIDLQAKKARVETSVNPTIISAAIEKAGYASSFTEV